MRFGDGYYMFSLLANLVGRANLRNVFLHGRQLLFYGIGDRVQGCAVLRPVPAELIHTFDQRPCYEQQDCNCKENNDERSQRARDMPVFHKRYDRIQKVREQHRHQDRYENRRRPVAESDHNSRRNDLGRCGIVADDFSMFQWHSRTITQAAPRYPPMCLRVHPRAPIR